MTSLYVHVPFCAQKCHYCAFYSEASTGELINRYVEALCREMQTVVADLRPTTIFFGGGTPSILNLRQWERILQVMHDLGLCGAAEWSVECNPATVSLDKARLLRSGGVNRLSMGVQSLDDSLLERLGRVHNREMVFKSFETLRRAGFDNLNIDLMFAIPTQTLQAWEVTVTEALAMGSEHLSSYEIIFEEDTALFAQLQAGEIDIDDELACFMYEVLVEKAIGSGLVQYEIANFARDEGGQKPHNEPSPGSRVPSRACRHNVNYWRGGDFYGLGPSATSYVRGERTRNWANTQLYCEQIEKGRRATESSERLMPLARAGETAAFGLRMVRGWDFEEFVAVTGHDLRGEWLKDMRELQARGHGLLEPSGFRLSKEGLRFADSAAALFLRP